MPSYILPALVTCLSYALASAEGACDVRARTAAGWLCGVLQLTKTTPYASFLGVPYAQQPLGELRFKELQPVEPWDYYYDATMEGPICPQHTMVYGPLMINRNMSEGCIYANVHVPLEALPRHHKPFSKHYQSPYETGHSDEDLTGLPIIVFVHGGGFAFGSGSTDLHSPEYLIEKDVIVITFNYRINVFGFLSLNSSSIPGNNGLRDIVTLLKWVRNNAKYFGGDSNNITIAGQSAGAASIHLLTLSPAAKGLFQRAILMSGVGIRSFFTPSPAYAAFISKIFLATVGINETDAEKVHRQLVKIPLESIMEANKQVQQLVGMTAFFPVVETAHTNFTMIIDEDPEASIIKGRGIDIPLIIGFTSKECETFRRIFEEVDILSRLEANPLLVLPIHLMYTTDTNIGLDLSKNIFKKYFKGAPTMDEYVAACDDMYYKYPAIKLAQTRQTLDGAPVFLYQFSYNADFSIFKHVMNNNIDGAPHIEDMTFIFEPQYLKRITRYPYRSERDFQMIEWMTSLFKNFMTCNDPTCNNNSTPEWPPVEDRSTKYLDIATPKLYRITDLTYKQQDMVKFLDSIQPQNG